MLTENTWNLIEAEEEAISPVTDTPQRLSLKISYIAEYILIF